MKEIKKAKVLSDEEYEKVKSASYAFKKMRERFNQIRAKAKEILDLQADQLSHKKRTKEESIRLKSNIRYGFEELCKMIGWESLFRTPELRSDQPKDSYLRYRYNLLSKNSKEFLESIGVGDTNLYDLTTNLDELFNIEVKRMKKNWSSTDKEETKSDETEVIVIKISSYKGFELPRKKCFIAIPGMIPFKEEDKYMAACCNKDITDSELFSMLIKVWNEYDHLALEKREDKKLRVKKAVAENIIGDVSELTEICQESNKALKEIAARKTGGMGRSEVQRAQHHSGKRK